MSKNNNIRFLLLCLFLFLITCNKINKSEMLSNKSKIDQNKEYLDFIKLYRNEESLKNEDLIIKKHYNKKLKKIENKILKFNNLIKKSYDKIEEIKSHKLCDSLELEIDLEEILLKKDERKKKDNKKDIIKYKNKISNLDIIISKNQDKLNFLNYLNHKRKPFHSINLSIKTNHIISMHYDKVIEKKTLINNISKNQIVLNDLKTKLENLNFFEVNDLGRINLQELNNYDGKLKNLLLTKKTKKQNLINILSKYYNTDDWNRMPSEGKYNKEIAKYQNLLNENKQNLTIYQNQLNNLINIFLNQDEQSIFDDKKRIADEAVNKCNLIIDDINFDEFYEEKCDSTNYNTYFLGILHVNSYTENHHYRILKYKLLTNCFYEIKNQNIKFHYTSKFTNEKDLMLSYADKCFEIMLLADQQISSLDKEFYTNKNKINSYNQKILLTKKSIENNTSKINLLKKQLNLEIDISNLNDEIYDLNKKISLIKKLKSEYYKSKNKLDNQIKIKSEEIDILNIKLKNINNDIYEAYIYLENEKDPIINENTKLTKEKNDLVKQKKRIEKKLKINNINIKEYKNTIEEKKFERLKIKNKMLKDNKVKIDKENKKITYYEKLKTKERKKYLELVIQIAYLKILWSFYLYINFKYSINESKNINSQNNLDNEDNFNELEFTTEKDFYKNNSFIETDYSSTSSSSSSSFFENNFIPLHNNRNYKSKNNLFNQSALPALNHEFHLNRSNIPSKNSTDIEWPINKKSRNNYISSDEDSDTDSTISSDSNNNSDFSSDEDSDSSSTTSSDLNNNNYPDFPNKENINNYSDLLTSDLRKTNNTNYNSRSLLTKKNSYRNRHNTTDEDSEYDLPTKYPFSNDVYLNKTSKPSTRYSHNNKTSSFSNNYSNDQVFPNYDADNDTDYFKNNDEYYSESDDGYYSESDDGYYSESDDGYYSESDGDSSGGGCGQAIGKAVGGAVIGIGTSIGIVAATTISPISSSIYYGLRITGHICNFTGELLGKNDPFFKNLGGKIHSSANIISDYANPLCLAASGIKATSDWFGIKSKFIDGTCSLIKSTGKLITGDIISGTKYAFESGKNFIGSDNKFSKILNIAQSGLSLFSGENVLEDTGNIISDGSSLLTDDKDNIGTRAGDMLSMVGSIGNKNSNVLQKTGNSSKHLLNFTLGRNNNITNYSNAISELGNSAESANKWSDENKEGKAKLNSDLNNSNVNNQILENSLNNNYDNNFIKNNNDIPSINPRGPNLISNNEDFITPKLKLFGLENNEEEIKEPKKENKLSKNKKALKIPNNDKYSIKSILDIDNNKINLSEIKEESLDELISEYKEFINLNPQFEIEELKSKQYKECYPTEYIENSKNNINSILRLDNDEDINETFTRNIINKTAPKKKKIKLLNINKNAFKNQIPKKWSLLNQISNNDDQVISNNKSWKPDITKLRVSEISELSEESAFALSHNEITFKEFKNSALNKFKQIGNIAINLGITLGKKWENLKNKHPKLLRFAPVLIGAGISICLASPAPLIAGLRQQFKQELVNVVAGDKITLIKEKLQESISELLQEKMSLNNDQANLIAKLSVYGLQLILLNKIANAKNKKLTKANDSNNSYNFTKNNKTGSGNSGSFGKFGNKKINKKVKVPKYSSKPPGSLTKLKNNQGWRDKKGFIWKKDKFHKDHWDVIDPKTNKKIKEIDFNGNKIWPSGPKNKNKK